MIVSCEKCKKRYRIKQDKLKEVKSTFKCVQCGHIIHTQNALEEKIGYASIFKLKIRNLDSPQKTLKKKSKSSAKSSSIPNKSRAAQLFYCYDILLEHFVGLLGKMIIFFFLIPAVIFTGSNLFSLWQLGALRQLVSKESVVLDNWLIEDKTTEICRAVASQINLYLKFHPKLHHRQLMQDSVFKSIAIQKAGPTDYTFLYQMSDPNGAFSIWAHENPNFIGIDIKQIYKSSLSAISEENYKQFVNLLRGVKGLKESRGVYQLMDSKGNIHNRFMVCTPIEGTPYVVSVTTAMDDFILPIQHFKRGIDNHTTTTRHMIIFTMVITIITIGAAVLIYGQRLRWSIIQLTHAADQISMGDLSAKVETDRKDEIGELAQAIFRIKKRLQVYLKRTCS
ncbi:MAG: HAMP domain-containing protein [Desulfobacteraceae bacterium]|jgi:HAMP domain-containing protein